MHLLTNVVMLKKSSTVKAWRERSCLCVNVYATLFSAMICDTSFEISSTLEHDKLELTLDDECEEMLDGSGRSPRPSPTLYSAPLCWWRATSDDRRSADSLRSSWSPPSRSSLHEKPSYTTCSTISSTQQNFYVLFEQCSTKFIEMSFMMTDDSFPPAYGYIH